MKHSLLIYGAYGYTGTLLAQAAREYGLEPILAGRDEAQLAALAHQTGFRYRVFSLQQPNEILAALQDVKVVLHAAGPFIHTARHMLEACLGTGTHYLDITGEIAVFEMAAGLHQRAEAAQIMLMPGTGFDVVPTDCLALLLKNKIPDATHLQLAFGTRRGGLSHGTATTMIQSLGEGGMERVNGQLQPTALGHKKLAVSIGQFRMFCMAIPWGDLSTAWRTTGIPNITTYTRISPKVFYLLKGQFLFNWLLRTSWVKKYLQQKIDNRAAGPNAAQRQQARSYLWGRVHNAQGATATASYTAPEGYTLTTHAALHIARQVMQNNWKPGFQTPAGCYGPLLVFELPHVEAIHWH